MSPKPGATSSVDDLVAAIRDDIMTGVLGPGHHINQDEWAQRMKVSRTPVRLALERLEAGGFVTLIAHRGAAVAETTTPYLEDILAGRLVLEAALARAGAGNLTAADLAVLRESNAEIQAIPLPGGHRDLAEPSQRFHASLYQAASLPMMTRFATQVVDHTHVFLNRYWYANRRIAHATKLYYAELLAACQAQNVERVEEVIREHRIDLAGVILQDRVSTSELRILPTLLSKKEMARLTALIDDEGDPTGPTPRPRRKPPGP